MKKFTPEERAERHRALMRNRYRAGAEAEQLERVKTLVNIVRSIETYEEAVAFVQHYYRVKEINKGE